MRILIALVALGLWMSALSLAGSWAPHRSPGRPTFHLAAVEVRP